MPWARIDDDFYIHPKVRRVWRCRPAIGLHALALSFCMRHGTEGEVPEWFVEDQLPDPGERDQATAALVDGGLWRLKGDSWEIHDFLVYNPSNADVRARRAADRERKRQRR